MELLPAPPSPTSSRFKKMKSFQIPDNFRSSLIGRVKEWRRQQDKMKKDFTPTRLDFGPVQVLLARHFGFCYGVENAVETAYRIIRENPGRRIFLLSEMIHNPEVNADLLSQGVRFLMDTAGRPLLDWHTLTPADIVIIPAFGTTLEIQETLQSMGIETAPYDTTCPFVEKVWNRAAAIGQKDYTVIVHGKPDHEETRATFSHARTQAPTVVVRNMAETRRLARYIGSEGSQAEFESEFVGQFSAGFDIVRDFQRIGVVNQTTMLAADTQAIADFLREVMVERFGISGSDVTPHFADTRDTLCYAPNDNQSATYGLLEQVADLCIVAGGYNSSNTSHLVELCQAQLPTYFIESARNLSADGRSIRYFDLEEKVEKTRVDFLPRKRPLTVMLTCGASCPDRVVEEILLKLLSFFSDARPADVVFSQLEAVS